MAFSMFLRSSGCPSRMFSQQFMRLATQTPLVPSIVTRAPPKPSRTLTLKEAKSAPIFNSVRAFSTSLVRRSEEKAHDHARLWVIERATSAILVPLIPLALLMPNKILDSVLAVLITAHSFWGLEAIAVDYVRASIFGPVIPKIAIGLVYLLSIATLGGLFYIISHDVGISNFFRQLWAVKANSDQKA